MIEKFLRFFSEPVYALPDVWPPKFDSFLPVIDKVLGWVFPAGVLIAVIMIVVGGYTWIVSGGDPARKQQAQGTLTWAVIGLVLLFLVYGILKAITNFILG